MNEIRIGLIGTRRGAFVPAACRFLDRARVTAVYDVAEALARETAAGIPDCRAFGPEEWEAFLDADINAVVITSPIPAHVEQSVACLSRGLHVLCEVTAATTLDEARQLVEAAAASSATYMMAENCCYLDEAILFARMANDGLLGEIFHAAGGYQHNCQQYWRHPDGSLTWRGQWESGIYCTHPLGPILAVLQDRVTQVSSLATPRAVIEPGMTGQNNHLMLMRTAAGRSIYLRIDHMSPQPYKCYFELQGTRGVCAFAYGMDTAPRICINGGHQWEPADNYVERYLADRRNLPAEAADLGHGSMEYWMMAAWADALLEGRPVPIDVHAALDYTLPGIVAAESALRDGAVLPVPDSREWVGLGISHQS